MGYEGSGYDIFQTAVHEIGHALGLNHTFELVNGQNPVGATIGALMDPIYNENFSGPQADDIAGIQYLYGPAATPEPSSYALMLLGLIGLFTFRHRQNHYNKA